MEIGFSASSSCCLRLSVGDEIKGRVERRDSVLMSSPYLSKWSSEISHGSGVSELFSPASINVAPINSSPARKSEHFAAIWYADLCSFTFCCALASEANWIYSPCDASERDGKRTPEWESEKLQRKICLLCMLSAIIIFYFHFCTLGSRFSQSSHRCLIATE